MKIPNITFRTYISLFLVLFSLGLGVVAAVNYAVDPYNDLGRNTIGLYFSTERQAKAKVLEAEHNAILMGSSRVAQINPDDLCGYDFYNAPFSSALPEEIYYFLRDYTRDEKLVAVGLDFYMFNEHSFPLEKDPLQTSIKKTTEYLLGLNVFVDSLKAVHSHRKNIKEAITPKGQFKKQTESQREQSVFDPQAYIKWINLFREKNYYKYQLSRERLEDVKKIDLMLRQKGIKPVFFINPLQRQLLAMVSSEPLRPIFLQWKAELKKRIPDLIDLTSSEYDYSDPALFVSSDPSHYLPETGALFLNRILKCE